MELSTENMIDDKPKNRLSAEEGVWMFVIGDMTIFGLFFAVFAYYYMLSPELYLASQAKLNANFGAANTVLLLSSSWFIVMALSAARKNIPTMAARLCMAAMFCGLGFAILKIIEYNEKLGAGISLVTNEFFMFYFIYTGIHFLHLLIGMVCLGYFLKKTWVSNISLADIPKLESVAVYWHMVDLLWIVLFPLLYLIK